MTTLVIVCLSIWFIGAVIAFYANYKHSNDQKIKVAREVIKGLWGHGIERQERLRRAGHDDIEIQRIVNQILTNSPISLNKKHKLFNPFWLILSVTFIIVISLVITVPTYQRIQTVGDAYVTCTINTNRNLYYREASDQYFILRTNDWDISHIFEIEYIDNDTAKEVIKVAEIVNAWDE